MARSTKTAAPDDDYQEQIVDIDVGEEMRSSFLEYAYSVIYSRALPDARDGLKPVQRRILYTMNDMNLRPDRGHVKCARVVGEVMGRLHPHGDGSIYDALVRQVQPWAMRLPLVDGHGNFGSLDDPPAAMRYTECRMALPALSMTGSIDEDTVDFRPNYDSREYEPSVLPSAIPNLLVNGATGIAVGMATNMAPHNLVEVVQALRHLVVHPEATTDDLMRFVPGPDLPSGGKIVGLDGIREAYATGRGTFRMRASTRVEAVSPRRQGIVVTELPYNVGAEKVIERIKVLAQTKKLHGIADLKNLTDRFHALRLVIEIKTGFHPEAVLEQLYRQTPMEETFGINAVCLVDGQPSTLGLKELLEIYLAHRIEVVRRRSEFRRTRHRDRLHLVDGLLIALLDIDEVIQLIRSSDDAATARTRLMSVFDLSELQATYILDMALRRLTRFSRIELETERDELRRQIEALSDILDQPAVLRALVSDELAQMAEQFGTPRRTVLLESAGQPVSASVPLEVTDDPCQVLLSSTGLLARTSGGEPFAAVGTRAKHDVIVSQARTTARGQVGVVTTLGRLHRLDVLDLPSLPPSASAPRLLGGAPLAEFLALDKGERALCLMSLQPDTGGLAVGTANGIVKRVTPDHPANRGSWEVVRLEEGDSLVGAATIERGDEQMCLITSDAQLLHFAASLVRPQGRSGGGVAGIRLAPGARVIFFGAVREPDDAVVVTLSGSSAALSGTQNGAAKVTPMREFPTKGRATGGVRAHRFVRGEDTLLIGWAGTGPAMAAAGSGTPVDLPPTDSRRDASGVPVGQPVVAVAGPLGPGT